MLSLTLLLVAQIKVTRKKGLAIYVQKSVHKDPMITTARSTTDHEGGTGQAALSSVMHGVTMSRADLTATTINCCSGSGERWVESCVCSQGRGRGWRDTFRSPQCLDKNKECVLDMFFPFSPKLGFQPRSSETRPGTL